MCVSVCVCTCVCDCVCVCVCRRKEGGGGGGNNRDIRIGLSPLCRSLELAMEILLIPSIGRVGVLL